MANVSVVGGHFVSCKSHRRSLVRQRLVNAQIWQSSHLERYFPARGLRRFGGSCPIYRESQLENGSNVPQHTNRLVLTLLEHLHDDPDKAVHIAKTIKARGAILLAGLGAM